MTGPRQQMSFERIKASLLSEAEALGVHPRGAPLDPVLELLINGFAHEMEAVHARIDEALEHNRRTLLRNFFSRPFLERPAQTVIGVTMKDSATVDPGLRITWQQAKQGSAPGYALIDTREMVPMEIGAAFYWLGNRIYSLRWDGTGRVASEEYPAAVETASPVLLLGLLSGAERVGSEHLSLLFLPDEAEVGAMFPGADPLINYVTYLDSAVWTAADAEGRFVPERILARKAGTSLMPGREETSRFPTARSFFARMAEEHYYAPMLYTFEKGLDLPPAALPTVLERLAAAEPDLAELAACAGRAAWISVKLPYLVHRDPRKLFPLVAVNAACAVGYRPLPRDRFHFKGVDYNLRTELFEFGMQNRPGHYCQTFGQWVVASLTDREGKEYPYVYDAVTRNVGRWFTLEAGADDVTLMIHVPRRQAPDVGYFDLHAGRILGEIANSMQLDVIAPLPANRHEYPAVADLRMLVPARGGGDGFFADQDGPDSLQEGGATALTRQYQRAAVWLRTRDKLYTLPDLESFLRAFDARVERIRSEHVTLTRQDCLVPAVRLNVTFAPTARLSPEEQAAVCGIATRQISERVPMGLWVEVRPEAREATA